MRCPALRARVLASAPLLALALVACGSSDSTVSKTPDARTTEAPAPSSQTVAAPAPSAPPADTPAPDPCAVNLAAPEIARAVSELPRDPRSNQPWNPEPLAGNYNECAPLSVVIVKANTNAENANTRAVMFHLGKFIPTGIPDTYGFNDIDETVSTGDTVGLKYTNGVPGLDSVVRFRWNGAGVELIGNVG
ncbi:LppP/LprE family lipoprotein [Mycobacterium sp. AMU20-3851]